jgi:broad specificity phosphatase PhoE
LLAGRFEGATQEIKQSITDYMNGWRYEQGIIYEPGETFEHYLRRVIRHILDLQKKKQRS